MIQESKIPVIVLGATGSVGQKFIQLLQDHRFFEVVEVMASEKSVGKKYADVVNWILPTPIPAKIADMTVKSCQPDDRSRFAFSGLDAAVAGDIEAIFAEAGYVVVSNSKNHRFDRDVPLLIPEVNPGHLELVRSQPYEKGMIITNPNCSVIGLTLALKPLDDQFGLDTVNVVTMQAVSGAGYPGVASLAILDNVIPFIGGEEPKMESEPKKILGKLNLDHIIPKDIKISAQCNRVGIVDGHMETVQVNLKRKASIDEIIQTWRSYQGEPQKLGLPSAPDQPIVYFDEEYYPQTRLHRSIGQGMTVSIGRLRPCEIFDYKFVVLSHNTMRGAAGGALLCAELLIKKGYYHPQ